MTAGPIPTSDLIRVLGPVPPAPPRTPFVLDSPHSGGVMPEDFGAAIGERELRDGEDCFIDRLWAPAAEAIGAPLLAALFPRTYLDPNRHAADLDPELLAEPWPGELLPSGKGSIGKSLIWRTMDKDRPIYDRRLTVAEVRRRIERCHRPYHATLVALMDAAHARHGAVYHLNCHSMGALTSELIEGVEGRPRPDFVLGDRDGTTCAPEFTAFVHRHLSGLGYDVRINDPFKGVELVRAYSAPQRGRHSLQIEINKRLYMDDQPTIAPHDGFATLQRQLAGLLAALDERFGSAR